MVLWFLDAECREKMKAKIGVRYHRRPIQLVAVVNRPDSFFQQPENLLCEP